MILLSAFAHPDDDFRERLRARLDAWIAARRPFHSNDEVRRFLGSLPSTPRAPFHLDGLALEIATRAVRIIFARATRWHYKFWLRVVSGEDVDAGNGILVRHSPLRATPLRESGQGTSHFRRRGCHLFAGQLLVEASEQARLAVRATCHARDGFEVELTGDVNWDLLRGLLGPGPAASDSPLTRFGLAGERTPEGVRLFTPTPEGIIQFSAMLVRGERLVLPLGGRFRVAVTLRDFDGPSSDLPATCIRLSQQTWLQGLPAIGLNLTEDDAAAIARWTGVPEEWLTPGVLAELCSSAFLDTRCPVEIPV